MHLCCANVICKVQRQFRKILTEFWDVIVWCLNCSVKLSYMLWSRAIVEYSNDFFQFRPSALVHLPTGEIRAIDSSASLPVIPHLVPPIPVHSAECYFWTSTRIALPSIE